jgi:hypothetical protein
VPGDIGGGRMAGGRLRPYSGKIRTRSVRLFWLSFALMIALAFGPEGFSAWSLVGEGITGTIFAVLIFVIIGSAFVGSACILYDWWAWLKNQG